MTNDIWYQLSQWIARHAVWLLACVSGSLVVVLLRLWVVSTRAARRVRKHHRMGKAAEVRARKLLKSHGYRIGQGQASASYELLVDKTRLPVVVRADFLVEKSGKVFVAEVKGGEESVKLTRATRRQLLEYHHAFDVDGILLVDMVHRRIFRVEFLD